MHNQQETLVILTPAFPGSEEESTWVPAVQLFVKKLGEEYPDLSLVVISFNYPCHSDRYPWRNAEIISLNGMHATKWKRLAIWRKAWKHLRRINREKKIVGLMSFWCGECALVGTYFARWHRILHYCWISGLDARKDNTRVKWIRPRPEELVAMSPFLSREFEKNHGVRPAHLIPIGIDPSEFPAQTVKRDIDIIGVGSLHAIKQYDLFIDVIGELAKTFPALRAVICGNGTDREKLQRRIAEKGLQQNLVLEGEKPHHEVLQWMQRAKIFLHTSSYEGFGLVYLEALYAGCRIISFTYPLSQPLSNWQVVASREEMTNAALTALAENNAAGKPVLIHSMTDSVHAMMKLFSLKKEK